MRLLGQAEKQREEVRGPGKHRGPHREQWVAATLWLPVPHSFIPEKLIVGLLGAGAGDSPWDSKKERQDPCPPGHTSSGGA